jgi:hypothetical protein
MLDEIESEKIRERRKKEEFKETCIKQLEENENFRRTHQNYKGKVIGRAEILEDNLFKNLFEPKKNISFEKGVKTDG